ncbi:MAG TPA: UPF0182 family protein [Gemmatimonadaceae bacterium]|nr:UPF0182 family protein [Gemmatimonadaceae bacterium]
MSPRRWAVLALVAAALVLLAGRALAALFTDYLWYRDVGALAVWRTKTFLDLVMRGASAAAAGAFVFVNLYAVRHSVVSLVLPRRVANLEIGEEVPGRYLLFIAVGLSLLFGALLTLPDDNWTSVALAARGVPFGESDPYFLYDLGFFVYWLPLERALFFWSLIAVLLTTALVVFLYALTPSLRWERGSLYVSGYVRRHLAALAALLLLLLAWSYRLDGFAALWRGSGVGGAFAFVDHRLTIPATRVLALAAASAAVIVWWAGWTGQVRVAVAAVAAVVLAAVLLRQVAPVLLLRFGTRAAAPVREREYLGARAGYTRRAFAVDRIVRSDSLGGFPTLSDAARGVTAWDGPALLRSVDRGPASAPTALAWTPTPSGVAAVIARAQSAERGRNDWAVMRVSAVTADARGAPVRVDAEGGATPEETILAGVLVYEGAAAYAIVADSTGQVVGTSLEGGTSRFAHAWSLQNFRLLTDDLPFPNPTVVTRRDVRDRVGAVAPFFTQGSTALPIWVAEALYWVLELYSSSTTYPLSERLTVAGGEYGYFQHAATAIVDAQTGRVTLVANPGADPVARSWQQTFPKLFAQRRALPTELLAALPPAMDGVRVQATAFARYGSRAESGVVREVPWEFDADSTLASAELPPMWLPSGQGVAPAVTLPLLADGRVAGLVLGGGGASPGTFWAPAEPRGPRWESVRTALRSAVDSGVAGAPAAPLVRGPARAIPVAGALTFVQPVYSWRPHGTPTLARVTVYSGGETRAGPSLAAITGLTPLAPQPPATPEDFRRRVGALYDAMRAALSRSDLKAFGDAYDALGALLGRAPR